MFFDQVRSSSMLSNAKWGLMIPVQANIPLGGLLGEVLWCQDLR